MSKASDKLAARADFIDRLRLYMLEKGQVTAKELAEEFDLTPRHIRYYMEAIADYHGTQRNRTYTLRLSDDLNALAKAVNECEGIKL